MKRFIQGLLLAIVVTAIGFGGSLLIVGCKAPSTQRVAVNTLFSVGKGVDAAYRSYIDLVIAGAVKTNQVPTVALQYADFQRAFRAALMVVTMNTNAPAPPELIQAAAHFTAVVTVLQKEDK